MNQRKKSNFIEWIYIFSVCLALILHVFNDLGVGELKLFHIPAAIAFLIHFKLLHKATKAQILSYIFIILTIISALLSPYPQSIQQAVTFMIVLGSCITIPICQYSRIIQITNLLIPIPLYMLSISLSSNISYRFTGFYNDPNYLCTTLLVFLFIILQGFYIFKNKIIKIGLLCEIIFIVVFTAATLSRTGVACILLIIVVSAWEFIKRFKTAAVILTVFGLIYLYSDTPHAIMEAIDKIESREDNIDNFSAASSLRYEISMSGVRHVLSNPIELPFGMGIGAVGHWKYFDSSVRNNHIDHNTLTASFSEQGIIGFIIYVLILYTTFRVNWNLPKDDKTRLIRLGAFLSIFIISLSINQMTYLPYWWLIFLLNNSSINNGNSSPPLFTDFC